MGNREEKKILAAEEIHRILIRLSHQILEKNPKASDIVLVGIQTRGVYLARRVQASINDIAGLLPPTGILDITFYRDDLTAVGLNPIVKTTDINFDINEKHVVLVDDVFFTGRTTRAALDELMDFGRPQKIELLVLVDRGHRELPIRADFVGKNIPTSLKEQVEVRLKESDGVDEVVVIEGSGGYK
ncbi:MAG: bifunctional pyr operon transcriptional regulator/uracil phosphoribosyltransferase PyrR [Candidatus Omnitrophica bacterium]|nr:bifunctional pyr operon transcriptional regulator/uracil phosphoribosyltransferase PyrR [Candidatus Omnitrophota bacterium]